MLLWLVVTATVIYLVVVLLMYIAQPKMVYFPSHHLDSDPSQVGLKFENIHFKSENGLTLHGWFVPTDSAQGTLLFCHGNAGNISDRLESIRQFNRLGLNVFIFDYRGYGKSEGKPSERGTYNDALAAWEYLVRQREIPAERVIIFGRSLGGAVAVWLAVHKNAGLLIVESSFTSMPDVAAHHYPFLPAKWLTRFKYESIENIKKVKIPVLFVHSPEDEIIPFKHGRILYQAANEPRQFLEISGPHNDGYYVSAEKYEAGIRSFLETYAKN